MQRFHFSYFSVNKFDIVYLSEAFLNSVILIDDENLQIPGYSIAKVEHPSNKKPGGICLLQNFITSEAARYKMFTRIH